MWSRILMMGLDLRKIRIINTHLFSFQTLVAVSDFSKNI